MSDADQQIQRNREMILTAKEKGLGATIGAYTKLSGPGWLQSAITLGGGSLSGALFLGVLGGTDMLWLQLMAIIMGVIMLSAISYVTLSTGKRPFPLINEHINPSGTNTKPMVNMPKNPNPTANHPMTGLFCGAWGPAPCGPGSPDPVPPGPVPLESAEFSFKLKGICAMSTPNISGVDWPHNAASIYSLSSP